MFSVLLVPSASYHVDEVGPLGEELAQRGHKVAIGTRFGYWDGVSPALRRFDLPVFAYREMDSWVDGLSLLLVLNDWGVNTKPLVERAAETGTLTIAKVEGAQDFDDLDVGRSRDAYRTSQVIFGQGLNDDEALTGCDVRIVGSSRLEGIWNQPARRPPPAKAVINLNFTYGVLEEERDLWLSTAVEGCRSAGVPFVLSVHPAEKSDLGGEYPVADQPVRHLLTQSSVLISRFSTVPFEAMARGVPFVYHNPHKEKVGAFADPGGAFEISHDSRSLAVALAEASKWNSDYRNRAEAFLRRQVDIHPDRPSAVRAADVIDSLIAR
jgi:hypothetical protein